MALIVEDGSGLANANSYATEAEADAYFVDLGNPEPWASASSANREIALIRATQYLDAEFGGRWLGVKNSGDQALDWPRYDAVTSDGHAIALDEIPARLKKATAEAAIKSAPVGALTLLADVSQPGDIIRQKSKVGELEQDTTYSSSGAGQQTQLALVEGILDELLDGVRSARIARG